MAKYKEKTSLGWEVLPEVKDRFRDWCVDKGCLTQDDCAGALTIWPHLPSIIREKAKKESKGISSIDVKFWEQFSAGLELALQAQLNSLQEKQDG